MNPSVYQFKERDKGYELYLGEYSTLQSLLLFDKEAKIKVTSFGATCYKNFTWATENELPEFGTVGDVVSFLKSEGDIGIVDFGASIINVGTLSTHDDGECNLFVKTKEHFIAILKAVAPTPYINLLINQLLENPGLYLSCNVSGCIEKYKTFKEYLAKNIRP